MILAAERFLSCKPPLGLFALANGICNGGHCAF
jgi:hypothetical protein